MGMRRRNDNARVATPAFLKDGRVLCGLGVATAIVVLLTIGGGSSGGGGSGVRGSGPESAFGMGTYEGGTGGALNEPYGGKLVNLVVPESEASEIKRRASGLKSLTLSKRQLCDIELLMSGAFSPLDSFMTEDVYKSVVSDLRLGPKYGNRVFPMPITLDVDDATASDVTVGSEIVLRDEFFNLVGIMTVQDKYRPDKMEEASKVLGTTDMSHPAVDYLMNTAGSWYLGGPIKGVRLPQHFDFPEDRRTPAEVREMLSSRGWNRVVAFQTRNPMHRAHIELTRLGAERLNAAVLIHPVVGMTKPGDVEYAVRVRCYRAIVESGRYYQKGGVAMSLLPLAMRMAGPREALWHAIIRKNHGASHFIVGRDHAGCKSANGDDFYGPYDAQELVKKYEKEIGIEIATFQMVKYLPNLDEYKPIDEIPEGAETLAISGTQFRAMMASGEEIPAWFSDPDVIKILREVSPPKRQRGFTILFTGLSGGGKTTISHALIQKIQSVLPTRHMTILDGDVVRTHLSKNLGFSVEDRNTNVARMGYVASEVTRHGGIAICSSIAPFEKSRAETRELVEATGGGFLLVHISTSAEECHRRDVKGLYEMAFQGKIELTGVSHPYENPDVAELTIDAEVVPVEQSVSYIIGWLVREGYIEEKLVATSERGKNLESDGVLTTGVTDPASRLCAKRRAESLDTTPEIILAIGGPADIESLRSSLDTKAKSLASSRQGHAHAIDLSSSDIAAIETKHGASLPSIRSEGYVADILYRTGTPLTSPVIEDNRTMVAWDIWTRARDIGSKKDVVVVTGPRMLPYLANILRIDPCARVAVHSTADNTAADVTRNLNAATAAIGAPSEDVKRYLQDYFAATASLAERYRPRFLTGTDPNAIASSAIH